MRNDMLPRNFPEKVNARRKRAFARMKPGNPAYEATSKKIIMGDLKGVRTKKNRTGSAKFRI